MRSSNSLVSMVLRKVSIIPEMALASEGVTAPSANADNNDPMTATLSEAVFIAGISNVTG